MEDYVTRSDWNAFMREFRELTHGYNLGNSTIDRGALRVNSDEGLIVNGSELVNGILRIVGMLVGEGIRVWNGPWADTGPGEITGDVDLTGSLEVLDDGSIKVGNVLIEDGMITVGVGGNLITIDGDTGKITAGGLTIDPTSNGGAVKFTSGPEVFANGGELDLYSTPGGAYITLNGAAAEVHGPGARWIRVTSTGIQIVGLPTRNASIYPGSFVGAVVADSSGNLFRIVPD